MIELMTRLMLIKNFNIPAGELNELSRNYVTAHSQSEAVERILSVLTDEEMDVYKRGRNMNGTAIPKSASAIEYRRATGLEVLFATLYLEEKHERLNELFEKAYSKKSDY